MTQAAHLLRVGTALTLVSVMAGPVAAQTIVNLHAVDDCYGTGGGVDVALPAGTYLATAIGPSEGGAHSSWNAWGGAISGCDAMGFGCVRGWWTLFFVHGRDADVMSLGGAVLADTQAKGLLNRHRVMFRLCEDGQARFSIPDSPAAACAGNVGGASVRIDPICAADLDADGELTLFDFLEFQNVFDAGASIADFDCDGELTLFDFLAFQNAFDAGCP